MSIDTLGIRSKAEKIGPDSYSPSQAIADSVEECVIDGESFYRLQHVDRIEPFFMSLVSSEDHWAFIASNGALSCGRGNPSGGVFPYYPSDTLLALRESTGPRTILHVCRKGRWIRWEPLRPQEVGTGIERNLYKNRLGSRIIFEEMHSRLGLVFRYQWSLSPRFGFVRTVDLENLDSYEKDVELLDGVRNILPWGLDPRFQLRFSNLGDAYKRAERGPHGIGVFSLSGIPTDRAQPNESLMASIAWSTGFSEPTILLSDRQLAHFRNRGRVSQEYDVRGCKGHYLIAADFVLGAYRKHSWRTIVDGCKDACDLTGLAHTLDTTSTIEQLLDEDVARGEESLQSYASTADGLQACRDGRRAGRHLSNVLFNIMRGGIPVSGYTIERDGFREHLHLRNPDVHDFFAHMLEKMAPVMSIQDLSATAIASTDPDFIRIAAEFLPLTLARRHGDPTRPWNSFDINPRTPQGNRRIGYEGNWRDIFQNWEALACSFPHLLRGMILRFVNSSTVDGYNPYRISESGFDWERPDEDETWANYGYWGDHQIVYLWKLLEKAQAMVPQQLGDLLTDRAACVYADIPYRIRDFAKLAQTPLTTIDYDVTVEKEILSRIESGGTDGLLVRDQTNEIHRVSLLEKLLLTACVKLCNFIPDAGVWLNTQRPEWNDAQNGLAGIGASLVTTSYLRGYLVFLRQRLEELPPDEFMLSEEVATLVDRLTSVLSENAGEGSREMPGHERHLMVSQLQGIAEGHRAAVYRRFTGRRLPVSSGQIASLLGNAIELLTKTLRRSRRSDGLYHSFTRVAFGQNSILVEPLEEMLEGQVAILESGMLAPREACDLLTALRSSHLYRSDQNSYLLYPDRDVPGFLEKNSLSIDRGRIAALVERLAGPESGGLLRQDVNGRVHFKGTLKTIDELNVAVDEWNQRNPHKSVTPEERIELCSAWEETFSHRFYIGRATRFFAYEGLGSIYWHMVSKLALAVARQCIAAREINDPAFESLLSQFREINEGMWLEKSAGSYGAFPTDPYSHTPAHAGAQQPGMTGQVKEDILTRLLELGVRIQDGRIRFDPCLLRDSEYLETEEVLRYHSLNSGLEILPIPAGSVAFTVCQVPVLYRKGTSAAALKVLYSNGDVRLSDTPELTAQESGDVFARTGGIVRIEVTLEEQR